jgi:hypothetical protein
MHNGLRLLHDGPDTQFSCDDAARGIELHQVAATHERAREVRNIDNRDLPRLGVPRHRVELHWN